MFLTVPPSWPIKLEKISIGPSSKKFIDTKIQKRRSNWKLGIFQWFSNQFISISFLWGYSLSFNSSFAFFTDVSFVPCPALHCQHITIGFRIVVFSSNKLFFLVSYKQLYSSLTRTWYSPFQLLSVKIFRTHTLCFRVLKWSSCDFCNSSFF